VEKTNHPHGVLAAVRGGDEPSGFLLGQRDKYTESCSGQGTLFVKSLTRDWWNDEVLIEVLTRVPGCPYRPVTMGRGRRWGPRRFRRLGDVRWRGW